MKRILEKLLNLGAIVGIPVVFYYFFNWSNWPLLLITFVLSLSALGWIVIWVEQLIKFFKN